MIFWIDIWIFTILIICLSLVCAFEFINWFHDTANSVAPVIYTKSLKAKYAVLIAWVMNFFWVIFWWIWVAMAIVYLLPIEAITYQSTSFWIIVVISLLLSAIIWNFLTWYFWIPASSSHSLIWAILWVTIVMQFIPIQWDIEIIPNWAKAIDVMKSLFFSPLFWFALASLIMLLLYKFIKSKYYFRTPSEKHKHPKQWLRIMLILTSAWVSFAHWSNDWQKWVWLAMLILILLLPNIFSINPNINKDEINKNIVILQNTLNYINTDLLNYEEIKKFDETIIHLSNINKNINSKEDYNKLELRKDVLSLKNNLNYLNSNVFINESKLHLVNIANSNLENINNNKINTNIDPILSIINFAPIWIILLISVSLWLWTMIWRKRIVVTIWERIWKTEMNYSQATTSALITAITITIASKFHLPVSTTHILSSSVAWTMSVWPNNSWVRKSTIKNIITAWVLTLPVTILLSGFIFLLLWFIIIK